MKRTIFWAVCFFLSACGGRTGEPTGAAAPQPSAGTPLATFNGVPITDEEIRSVAGSSLVRAEMELYEARKAGIDQLIDQKLLEEEAKKGGVTVDEFLNKKVQQKVAVTDKDVEKFYNENKPRFSGKKLEEIKPQIQGMLQREKYQQEYGKLTAGLRKKAKVEIHIKPPRAEIAEGDWPSIGPKDAPVTLVEFTDYQCPFCGRVRPTITQILEEYKGKLRYVLKDFPLSFHQDSFKAHEAAHCAGDQGKYWEMNKRLFGNQRAIGVEDLKKYAGELKLNTGKFEECLGSGLYAAKVQQSLQDGQKAGVSGTPAFFVNGRLISGARPFESFKELIDDELATR